MILLLIGIPLFVLGLLEAAHPPFQRWLYERNNKETVNVDSEKYRNAVFWMKQTGAGLALGSGFLVIMALSDLGLIH
ncbi:MAG TPA: hypothetical protein VMT72_10365 [Pseudolabrys sp.]|nr:hypothetical protein [Pseudolabrys sp.]